MLSLSPSLPCLLSVCPRSPLLSICDGVWRAHRCVAWGHEGRSGGKREGGRASLCTLLTSWIGGCSSSPPASVRVFRVRARAARAILPPRSPSPLFAPPLGCRATCGGVDSPVIRDRRKERKQTRGRHTGHAGIRTSRRVERRGLGNSGPRRPLLLRSQISVSAWASNRTHRGNKAQNGHIRTNEVAMGFVR